MSKPVISDRMHKLIDKLEAANASFQYEADQRCIDGVPKAEAKLARARAALEEAIAALEADLRALKEYAAEATFNSAT